MRNFDWQMIAVLVCVAVAVWSLMARFRKLMAGKGGCGDCANSKPAASSTAEPELVSEDRIEILYETKD